MGNKYYIDLDVLSRRFDASNHKKNIKEKSISEKIHHLIEEGEIECISSEALKVETKPIREPLKRSWIFNLYKKKGFVACIGTTQEMLDLRDKLVKKCGFTDRQQMDALHVTVAAISKVDVFITFNAKDFILDSRKKCIEAFFKRELKHKIIVSIPQKVPSLIQLGHF